MLPWPGVLVTATRPLWTWVMYLMMARPRPMPAGIDDVMHLAGCGVSRLFRVPSRSPVRTRAKSAWGLKGLESCQVTTWPFSVNKAGEPFHGVSFSEWCKGGA